MRKTHQLSKQNDHLSDGANLVGTFPSVLKCLKSSNGLFYADRKMHVKIERSYLLLLKSRLIASLPLINVVTKIKIYQLLKLLNEKKMAKSLEDLSASFNVEFY